MNILSLCLFSKQHKRVYMKKNIVKTFIVYILGIFVMSNGTTLYPYIIIYFFNERT